MIVLDHEKLSPEFYTSESLEVQKLELNGEGNDFIKLGQNEPNPFKNNTTIRYSLQKDAQVELSLYDFTGRLIKTMDIEGKEGVNSLELNSEGLGTGLVYYKVKTEQFSAVKNMIIID